MSLENADSFISRCHGLVGGFALKKSNNRSVSALQVTKQDGPFFCSKCLSEAIVRKCVDKDDHFAHKANYSPIVTRKETALHNSCKLEILNSLKQSCPEGKWEAERPIPANVEKGIPVLIPDISGRVGDAPVCIEVQTSTYTINKIAQKMSDYHKRSLNVLWILPLKAALGKNEFRPRLFEKFLHSMYFGRIYYWLPGKGSILIPVHYSPTKRKIEVSTWFDTDIQEEVTVGGYELTYKTIKIANYGNEVDIAKDFKGVIRKRWSPSNVKKEIPECTIYTDAQSKWWNSKEFKEIETQKLVVSKSKLPLRIYEDDDYFDEYDSLDSEYIND